MSDILKDIAEARSLLSNLDLSVDGEAALDSLLDRAAAEIGALRGACEELLSWYDGIVTENEEALSERTEFVGFCEFEAILQADSDDDFFVTADDPELAAIVERMRAALTQEPQQ